MDFAKKQLLKYGWTEGKGLGKKENGISEALKPKLKRSVTGVGYDAASDFTEHWWSHLYDKAAGNVEVEEKNGKTKKIKTKEHDGFTITTSTWRMNKKKSNNNGVYSEHFIKKAILTNEEKKVENMSESDSDDKTEKKDVFKMTDEELFAACEGRTAHKGARHGLKAIGKLARIAQQEQMLLTQSRFSGYSHAEKLRKHKNNEEVVENMSLNDEIPIIRKKKKRKRCTSLNSERLAESNECPLPDVIETNIDSVASEDETEKIGRKSKKRKSKDLVEIESTDKSIKSEENNKCLNNIPVEMDMETNTTGNDCNIIKKKRKKKKC